MKQRHEMSLIPGGMIGPPRNKHHVREWTMPEFAKYLSSRATILRHFISNKSQWTQCAVLDGIGAPGVVARTIMDHMQERKERARIINERVRSSLLEKRKRT